VIAAAAATSQVLLELGGVLLALAVLGRIATRLNVPSIPLFLAAGLLAGEGGLIPLDASQDFIAVGADIGVVLLLAMLGLEYTPGELRHGLRTNWAGGLLDLLVNLPLGVVMGLVLGWDLVPALLLGGVTYISSSGIIAKLLADLDRFANRDTPVVLSILVLEDLFMAVLLPVFAVLIVGADIATGAVSVAVALAIVGTALVVSARYGHHATRLVSSGSDELLLLTVFGLTLFVAGLAEQVKVSAAVGAFLLGLTLSGQVVERGRRMLTPLRDVFGGLFFVAFGLRVDPSTLPPMLVPAVILAVATAASKVWTGWTAGRHAGLGPRGRWRAGWSLVPRGEFSIVIAGLGVAAGLEPDLGPLAAAYVLILAVVGSVFMRAADRLPLPRRLATPTVATRR
jgi:monovalent cation:H+ antiporter-2, CPA2 family